MEYPTKYDFFLQFKALYNQDKEFQDYILVNNSESFQDVFCIRPEDILGKKISEIVIEDESDIFGIKDLYYHFIPKTNRKFEKYIDELGRWYSINIYSDLRDYLLLVYNDISDIKINLEC